ncbi:MAG TPA: alpha/beta hydrolase-fold protein [Anaerolineales bacterium]|nr:alpha/beta hydrolase-fold protein [Anaerolineales bacterium]HNN13032.1 alpha/beta hydrolase-fold protein [Anaerolineales bacterium]HNO30486.1 alpha/beta hydrolase-fold protein [Anaerolineales bacterium]
MILQRHESFPSQFVKARNVDVWLPEDYSGQKRYSVLYMQDGQNIVEPISAIGGVSWGIDQALERLGRDVIVVGVWNHGEIRWQEYMPQKVYEAPSFEPLREKFLARAGGPPISDAYLKCLVKEIKPFIDSNYSTLPDQSHTFVMGSSMGGLASLNAISQYPDVFHGAGCLSTHWSAGEMPLVEGMAKVLPDPGSHKLYFDFGKLGLDAFYEPFQVKFDEHLRARGYLADQNWVTRKFESADHNESAWRARVDVPLSFLFS